MTDHTIPGLIAIVAIVVVVAAFMSVAPQTTISADTQPETLLGQAIQPQLQEPGVVDNACEPKRYCDGTKLTVIRGDCSVNYAHCQYGCSQGACI